MALFGPVMKLKRNLGRTDSCRGGKYLTPEAPAVQPGDFAAGSLISKVVVLYHVIPILHTMMSRQHDVSEHV